MEHPPGTQPGPSQQGPQAQGGQQGVSPQMIIQSITSEAQQGWTIMMTMLTARVQLDAMGATRQDRQALIGFWHESFVQPHIDRWADMIDSPRNRQSLMGGPVSADELIDRIRMMGPELQQQFMTYILRGADEPVSNISEALDDFKALREERSDSQEQPGDE